MRVVTIVSLGASAVLGLAALVVAKTVLPNQAAARVPGLAGQPVAGVPVVVAAKDMKFGDKLDADHLRIMQLPPDAVPQGAFTTVAAVLSADHGGPPVALAPIVAREPVLPAKLSGPGARASVAAEIADGLRAYTIRVNDVAGVGGHALPGDRVDVMLLRDQTPTGPIHTYVSQVVLQDVRVLAVDLNADQASNHPATPSTATLEVSIADSQKLAAAGDLGKLSLALRRTGEAQTTPTAMFRSSEFGAGAGAPAAPGPRRAAGRTRYGGPILIVYGASHGGGERQGAAQPAAAAPAAPAAPASAPAAPAAAKAFLG